MKIRALELHASSNIWNPDGLLDILGLMSELELNTLVLHEVGIIERLVYPGEYFGASPDEVGVNRRYRSAYKSLYRFDPGRRSRPYQHLSFLRWLARRAAEKNIDLYLNNKELWFADSLLRMRPDLLVNGVPCPTAPGWIDFVQTKYDELFTDFPELAGTITAPGTGESRLSFAAAWCECGRCASTDPAAWYSAVIDAMYRASRKHDKTLVVRDFVFTRSNQDELTDGLRTMPDDIVISLKNTPHDYYPTFPDNPRIGDVGSHSQWVEFDAMGQYFGWGIAPALIMEDSRDRMDHARSNGVEGVLIRIDWEGLEGHSALRTVNAANVDALAALATDPNASGHDVYARWAVRVGALKPDQSTDIADDAVRWLQKTLGATWSITSRALFVRDCVFNDSSQFPVSVDHAYWLAEEKNSLRDWDPSKEGALSWDAANVLSLVREKDEASSEVRQLTERVASGHPGLDSEWLEDLQRCFEVYVVYVEAFSAAARGVFAGRHVREFGGQANDQVREVAFDSIERMRTQIAELRSSGIADWHPAAAALSADRLECLMEDVQSIVADSTT